MVPLAQASMLATQAQKQSEHISSPHNFASPIKIASIKKVTYTIAQLGGDLMLKNAPSGGLIVMIDLPLGEPVE